MENVFENVLGGREGGTRGRGGWEVIQNVLGGREGGTRREVGGR